MAKTRIEWVRRLPDEILPSTIYLLRSESGSFAEIFLSNSDASEVRHIFNATDAEAMIREAIAEHSELLVVDNIEQRDQLVLTRNTQVLVLDASGDETVSHGAATYIYRKDSEEFVKISEFESLDITPHWDDLVGKPASGPDSIDEAVQKAHGHANHTVLDKFHEEDGDLSYGDEKIVTTRNNEW